MLNRGTVGSVTLKNSKLDTDPESTTMFKRLHLLQLHWTLQEIC